MIVKLVPPGSDGSTLQYLLNTDRAAKPEVLSGNPTLLAAMIARSGSVEPYTMFCFSFAERAGDLAPGIVPAVLASAEAVLFPGLDLRYVMRASIRHTDKAEGRLELNHVVLNRHLGSGKVFSPYVHSRDGRLFPMWAELVNRRHNLLSANAAKNVRGFRVPDALPLWQKVNLLNIGRSVSQEVDKGEITCRAQVIEHLQIGLGLKVVGSDSTSLEVEVGKTPRLRLQGDFYRENWQAGVEGPQSAIQRFRRELREMPTTKLLAEVVGRVHRRGEILGEQVRRRPRHQPRIQLPHVDLGPVIAGRESNPTAALGTTPVIAMAVERVDRLVRRVCQRSEEVWQMLLDALRRGCQRARQRDAEVEAQVAGRRRRFGIHLTSRVGLATTTVPDSHSSLRRICARAHQRNRHAEAQVAAVRRRYQSSAAASPLSDRSRQREAQAQAQAHVSTRRARGRAGPEAIGAEPITGLLVSAPALASSPQPSPGTDRAPSRSPAESASNAKRQAEVDAWLAQTPMAKPQTASATKVIASQRHQSAPSAPVPASPAASPSVPPTSPKVRFSQVPAGDRTTRTKPGVSGPRPPAGAPRRPKPGRG